MPLVRIDAPEFYADAEFQLWLNDPTRNQATWHKKGTYPNEYSDMFFTVDPPDGSDSDMPQHIWDKIVASCAEAVGSCACVVWLSNVSL